MCSHTFEYINLTSTLTAHLSVNRGFDLAYFWDFDSKTMKSKEKNQEIRCEKNYLLVDEILTNNYVFFDQVNSEVVIMHVQ